MTANYGEANHRHRYAAWCASRAVNLKGEKGIEIAEKAGLNQLCAGWRELPNANQINENGIWHGEIKNGVCRAISDVLGKRKAETFIYNGGLEKFIKCYLKSVFLASVQEQLSPENEAKREAIRKICNVHEIGQANFRHDFAALYSSKATRRARPLIFDEEKGIDIIEKSGMRDLWPDWESLPSSNNFDKCHSQLRNEMCKIASFVLKEEIRKSNQVFTHGRAAKLINIYLKSLFLASPQETLSLENIAKRNAIHPPVDRVLAEGLRDIAKKREKPSGIMIDEWESIRKNKETWDMLIKPHGSGGKPWSKMSQFEYMDVIDSIREVVESSGNQGLWTIEKYWQGFQG